MNSLKTLAIVAAAAGLSGIGQTQSLVFGDGLARQCYVDAVSGNPGRASSIARCQTALQRVGMSKIHRASTLVNLGILQMRAGQHDEALAALDKSLDIAPGSPEALINRGAVMIYLGRHEEAISDLTQSIELGTSKLPEALYNRALAYEKLGAFEKAYDDLTRAIELRPDFEEAQNTLSRYSVQDVSE